MNSQDDYFDGDMSDEEYRRRIRREQESDKFYARQRELHNQSANKVRYSPPEDEDSGSMW